jgi:sugar phosphate isomerase/epimerase
VPGDVVQNVPSDAIDGMTRRRLMASCAAVTAAPGMLHAKARITRAQISGITDELGRTQSDAIAFAKQNGLQWVELRGVPESGKEFALLPEAELKRHAAELAASQLKVSLLKTSLLKFPWPELSPGQTNEAATARWNRRREDLGRAIAAAHILGTDKIRIFTGARVAAPERAYPAIVRALEELTSAAETARVRLLIENEPSQNIGTCAELKAILDLLPSKAIGFNWDPWNALALQEMPWPDGYAQLPKTRMLNLQVKAEGLSGRPQQIPWKKLLNAAQRDGYAGAVSLATEVFDGTFEKAGAAIHELRHTIGELD